MPKELEVSHRSADAPVIDFEIEKILEGREVPSWFSRYQFGDFQGLPVRLLHCYENSKCANLREFLKLGSAGRFKLRNYGRKTESELRRIVSDLLSQNSGGPQSDEEEEGSSVGEESLSSTQISFSTLEAHAKPWHLVDGEMWKNWAIAIGSKNSRRVGDVAESLGINWPSSMRNTAIAEYTARPLSEVARLPRMGRVKLRAIVLSVAYLVFHDDQPEANSVESILQSPALRNLDDRERFILEKRLLVPERRQMTLEAVSREQGVTRERIRQVEKIILTRLRESSFGARIGQLLEASKCDIFQRLSGGELYLTNEQLVTKEHDFGGPQLLAIYLEGRTLRAWLDARFVRIRDCWFCGSADEWATIERRLSGWRAEQLPLPESVVAGSSNVTVREARAYFGCSERAIPFEGYILPSGNVMARRSARLHAFIAAENWNGKDPAAASEACAEATGVGNGIDHARHGYRAILSTPSLFLSSPGAVIPLHQAAPWRPTQANFTDEQEDSSGIPRAEAKIADVFRKAGPLTLGTAVDVCKSDDMLGIAAGSVGAIISQSRRFVRLAPGLYDVREMVGEPSRIEQARACLLNEKDMRRYCFAKHSGEELTSMFPLWDMEQEKRWAYWGKTALSSDALGSLFAVSTPDSWPGGEESLHAEWIQWKAEGRWRYKVTWNDDLPTDIPSVRDVLLTCQYARLAGKISWVRANYILGATQITERAGLSSIVLGVILGLIAPTGRNRWLSHSAHHDFDREWIGYENLLLGDNEPAWTNPHFQGKFARASLLAASAQLGWVEASEVSVLRSISTSGQLRPRSAPLTQIEPESVDDNDVRI